MSQRCPVQRLKVVWPSAKTAFLPRVFKGTLTAVAACALLAACNSPPKIVPAELTQIQSTRGAKTVWSTGVGGGGDRPAVRFAPFVTETSVYTASASGKVSAVSRETGQALWSVNVGRPLTAGISGDSSLLFVATGDGEVFSLRREDGTRVWSARVASEVIASPVAGPDHVVVRSIDGKVYSLDKNTGRQRWRFSYKVPALSLHGNGRPLVGSDGVLVGLDNGKLVALHGADGQVSWELSLSEGGGRSEVERLNDLDADIRAGGKYVYAVNYQGTLAQIDPSRGSARWMANMSSSAGLAVSDEIVVVTDEFDTVWGLSTADGSVLWEQDALTYRKLTAPAVVDESTIAVGDFDGYLHLLSLADGALIGRHKVGSGQIMSQPVIRDGQGYVQLRGGRLAAISF
jgi:outer membrane protein assembly factor BamB